MFIGLGQTLGSLGIQPWWRRMMTSLIGHNWLGSYLEDGYIEDGYINNDYVE